MDLDLVVKEEKSKIYREAELALAVHGLSPIGGASPIAASDIAYRLSGGAANSNVNSSLGGAKSSVAVVDNTDNNLFRDITGTEHTAGIILYRCIYIHNNHGSLTLTSPVVWIASDTTGTDSDLSISIGTAAVSGTEQTVGAETTAPTGSAATFSDAAVSRATGLALGDLAPAAHKAVWIRLTITAGSTPQAVDTAQIQAGGDTL